MKYVRCFLAVFLCLCLCGCGSTKADTAVDVDLTQLSSTMVYAEVSNMLSAPEAYVGKVVKMQGAFSVYVGQTQVYFACVIADATACCSQGIEFVLAGDHDYPDDYPQLGSNITVTGTFQTYEEDGYQYITLTDATMN